MPSRRKQVLSCSIVGLALTALAVAHPDDPKVRDTLPGYVGPGYRAGDEIRRTRGGDEPGSMTAGRSDRGGRETVYENLFSGQNIYLNAWLPTAEFGLTQTNGNDIWGYTSPSGREYALVGLSDGTGIAEVTDPDNTYVITTIPGPRSIWRDIKVYGHYAYVVTETLAEGGAPSGIQVVDLSNIDADPGVGEPPRVELVNTVTEGGFGFTHNVAINTESGFLYRVGGSNMGLRAYDLNADPVNPTHQADWVWHDRYVHDAQIVTWESDDQYDGREIAFCCGGFNNGWTSPGLIILDVTDKSNMTVIAAYEYPDAEYSHQGWLSRDRQYFFLNDEKDEDNLGVTSRMHVIDVSDLANPFEAHVYTNGNTAVTHNLYVKGDMVFASNYRSGLRVFNVCDPLAPVEIANFDTWPGSDAASFNGLWSNYPYFESGTIIGSDREKGLFVWTMNLPSPPFDLNGDFLVDVKDLLAVINAWGDCGPQPLCNPCETDFDGSGTTDSEDLLLMINAWGAVPPPGLP